MSEHTARGLLGRMRSGPWMRALRRRAVFSSRPQGRLAVSRGVRWPCTAHSCAPTVHVGLSNRGRDQPPHSANRGDQCPAWSVYAPGNRELKKWKNDRL